MSAGGEHGAFTIARASEFASALLLAESYLEHHQQARFAIVLADRAAEEARALLPRRSFLVDVDALQLPDAARFVYRHAGEELCAALRPFAFAELFASHGFDSLAYIDPGSLVLAPLAALDGALPHAPLVLLPRWHAPPFDPPTAQAALRSGAFSRKLIALRATPEVMRALDWWMESVYREGMADAAGNEGEAPCPLDLLAAWIPEAAILRSRSFACGLPDLLEHPPEFAVGTWRTRGETLCVLEIGTAAGVDMPVIEGPGGEMTALLRAREARLQAVQDAGAASTMESFARLANGVRLPVHLVRDALRWALRDGVPVPDPRRDPEGFCAFLMRKGLVADAPRVPLLLHFLLRRRADLMEAFPAAGSDGDDAGFRGWIEEYGAREEGIGDLLAYAGLEEERDPVACLLARLRSAGRRDAIERLEAALASSTGFARYCDWLDGEAARGTGVSAEEAACMRSACGGVARILNIYFLRADLQRAFPVLGADKDASAFAGWLRANRFRAGLTHAEISLFAEFARARADCVERMRFLYQHMAPQAAPAPVPTIYSIATICADKRIAIAESDIARWLATEPALAPVEQYLAHAGADTGAAAAEAAAFDLPEVGQLDARDNAAFAAAVRGGLAARENGRRRMNFAGFLNAPTGMGQCARSLLETLRHENLAVHAYCLPHPKAQSTAVPRAAMFGWPGGDAELSLSVANADSRRILAEVLPGCHWARRNIAYWMWETEALPARYRPSQQPFDEIWTASEYSAAAIRRTVDRPVHVLPLALDLEQLDRARPRRARFGLPEDELLVGFVFDLESVLERKNVDGLITAFERAFSQQEKCRLVLKVNGAGRGDFGFEMLMRRALESRIIVLPEVLSAEETCDFLFSLDVYASLHRAEGFGFTCAEAMALGVPVVASGYSGNLEFMNTQNSLLVPVEVYETERSYGPYPEGSRWGAPDLDAAAAMLRSLLDPQHRRALGAIGRSEVRRRLCAGNLVMRARQLLAG